jgi:hypothetical protein
VLCDNGVIFRRAYVPSGTQVHRDFLITLYMVSVYKIGTEVQSFYFAKHDF